MSKERSAPAIFVASVIALVVMRRLGRHLHNLSLGSTMKILNLIVIKEVNRLTKQQWRKDLASIYQGNYFEITAFHGAHADVFSVVPCLLFQQTAFRWRDCRGPPDCRGPLS